MSIEQESSVNSYLEYEILGSWWAGWIPTEKFQKIIANYFYRKVMRKYNRMNLIKEQTEVMK